MYQPPVQALAMGRQLALLVGKASPRGQIASARLPGKTPLAALLDAALVIVVPWIVGAALPVQLAMQAAFRACIGLEFFAKG